MGAANADGVRAFGAPTITDPVALLCCRRRRHPDRPLSRLLGGARNLGVRLVAPRQPNDPAVYTDIIDLQVQPPYRVVGANRDATQSVLQPLPPEELDDEGNLYSNGEVIIEGGHRLDFDADNRMELVCGRDRRQGLCR